MLEGRKPNRQKKSGLDVQVIKGYTSATRKLVLGVCCICKCAMLLLCPRYDL